MTYNFHATGPANRRAFLAGSAAVVAGSMVYGRAAHAANAGARKPIIIDGKRIKTVDVHAHCATDSMNIVAGTALEKTLAGVLKGGSQANMIIGADRLTIMDQEGIDVQALTINPYWYGADRDLATKLIDDQNKKLAEIPKAFPGRFVVMASAALQFPELAAQQLEYAYKTYGMRGVGIGASVGAMELSDPKMDVFWAKCQELNTFIFIHPQNGDVVSGIAERVKGNGLLGNVIGNPLETTIGLSHMIFEGTLDKFPNLRLCGAHGGGYLISYPSRSDHGCLMSPAQCKGPVLKKKPSEYIHGLYVDSLVFTSEMLRHLIAETGISQIMIGTDCPFPWTTTPIEHVMNTPGLSDADRIAILGGNACRLLGIPA